MISNNLIERFQNYKLGVPQLDDEHFQLLVLIDDARRTTDLEEIKKILEDLLKLWDKHNLTEESIMRENKFRFIEYHLHMHEMFRLRLVKAIYKLERCDSYTLMDFNDTTALVFDLECHMDHYDRQFTEKA